MFLMADSSSLIPSNILRNLAHKDDEKRKEAANEIASLVKQLYDEGVSLDDTQGSERIKAIVELLDTKYVSSIDVNYRKGGLIGLASVIYGLRADGDLLYSTGVMHLEKIVPLVLNAFSDLDSGIRFQACEALYNIVKAAKGDVIVYYNQIFDALCKLSADPDVAVHRAALILDQGLKDIVCTSDQFSIEEFMRLVSERLSILNPCVRTFLLSWIDAVSSCPEIDMLGYLPDILDGLLNMLSDSDSGVHRKTAMTLYHFLEEAETSPSVDPVRVVRILVRKASSSEKSTRLTVFKWIHKFVKLGGEMLVPYYADILEVILSGMSDEDEMIRQVAHQTNEDIHAIEVSSDRKLNIGAILSVIRRQLSCPSETTRIQALHWIETCVAINHAEVTTFQDNLLETLLKSVSDPSTEVVLLVLKLLASMARDPQNFNLLVVSLVKSFQVDIQLLQNRGSMIICRICVLLDARSVYHELATVLQGQEDLDFVSTMVEALNIILLTSPELFGLRVLLKESPANDSGKDLFLTLYATWCYSPPATISLCLLSQAYQHTTCLILALAEEDLNLKFFVHLDKLIRLLETPTFVHLRLQLLQPQRFAWLVKALYGLLMLLPQHSEAFKILEARLATISPSYVQLEQVLLLDKKLHSLGNKPNGLQILDGGEKIDSADFTVLLQIFQHAKHQYQKHLRAQVNVQCAPRPGDSN